MLLKKWYFSSLLWQHLKHSFPENLNEIIKLNNLINHSYVYLKLMGIIRPVSMDHLLALQTFETLLAPILFPVWEFLVGTILNSGTLNPHYGKKIVFNDIYWIVFTSMILYTYTKGYIAICQICYVFVILPLGNSVGTFQIIYNLLNV